MLDKAYEPKKYEDDIYQRWENSGFFNPDVCVEKGVTSEKAEPFSIVLPPPNVTGTLHMGHAAMLAIEDMMVRYHRMKGDLTLWVPGTDHAAVATESKVEGLLIKDEGFTKPKEELGREKFLERVKKFAQDSHDTIVNQSKKMGSSLDWSREAYTLDDERNLAVRTVFKDMYDAGLIYRGYRVVNWSVKGQSTCSDDELVHVERPGKLYYFKYSKDFPISIATTRPETKLGDTAVAVHPEGQWKNFIGQEFTVADFGQKGHELKIKIIGDANVDDSFGAGALGVTTAHSPIDFEMYLRQKALGNDIGLIQVIGEDGKMTINAGSDYAGLTVEEARTKVVQWLKDEGLLEKEEDTIQNVGTSDRFKDVVEPLPKTQWFIDVNKKVPGRGIFAGRELSLKEMMQEVVRENKIEIVPDRFNKTYFHWIDNLRDWCISRQIWFGHQIPVWYKGNEIYCDIEAPKGEGWTQDPDTLDTWFSSGLWTFSTLGWPANTEDFKRFHPTSVLETGYDILFFWVARMILMTTYTLGEVPFKTVYLHGLVRDEQGRKMSKSLGNIIDPLDMINKYGTDATRLSLLLGNTPGNDMKLSEEKIAGFRNFTNKLWNISRFMLMNIEKPEINSSKPIPKTLADEWVLYQLDYTAHAVENSIKYNQFSGAGDFLRIFTWDLLADWYLEIAKVEGEKSQILNYILNTLLKLWHPYMPFVTETIWREVYGEDAILMVEKWPEVKNFESRDDYFQGFNDVRSTINLIRNVRAEFKIEPAKKVVATVKAKNQKLFEENSSVIVSLSRLENLVFDSNYQKTETSVGFVVGETEVYVELSGLVNKDKEKVRLEKEIATVAPYVESMKKKLSNTEFVNNAPPAVIDGERKKLADAEAKLTALTAQLSAL